MSGRSSRARRVEATRRAFADVYRLRGAEMPPPPFGNERQDRIYAQQYAKYRRSYWHAERMVAELAEVYGYPAMPSCDYCGKEAKLVTGAVIYPHRTDLHGLKFWQCAPCDAYVGCHKVEGGNGDGTKPLGRLANAELRAAKQRAHTAFDPIWRERKMKRHTAYGWLADKLGISKADCHIGMMDVETCERVVAACRET